MPSIADAIASINRVFREFKRFSGDGLPGEPTGAPLPIGDPQSGPYSAKKSELRAAIGGSLEAVQEALEEIVAGAVPDGGVTDPKLGDTLSAALANIVATRTALKALNTSRKKVAYLTEPGREGMFAWKTGNFSAKIGYDTQEGVYVKADGIAATAGAWVRQYTGDVNILWFGVSNADVASNAGIEAWGVFCMKEDKRGYAPAGYYRHSDRWVIDTANAIGAGSLRLRGDGAYRTIFTASSALGDNFHILKLGPTDENGQKVHAYGSFEDMGFVSDCAGPVMTIGGNDLVDTAGNYSLKNVFISNINSANGAVPSLHLNYLFDCTFENIVVVGKVGYGDALNMRQCHFCTFIGGSYSNAINGIVANGYNYSNTFIGPDFENVLVGWLNVQAADENNILLNPFFDIYNPLTGVSAGVAVRSLNCGAGGIILDSPYLQPRANSALIDTASQVNVFLRGSAKGGVVTPPFPASDVAVTNNTGRTILVRFSNVAGTLSSVFVNAEETPMTGGAIVLLPRQTIAPRYTGTAPVWRWNVMV